MNPETKLSTNDTKRLLNKLISKIKFVKNIRKTNTAIPKHIPSSNSFS